MAGQNKYHVLVVEDVDDERTQYELILTGKGYAVSTVGSYQSAIETINGNTFDVALIDIELDKYDSKNADGLRVVAQLNKLENRPQVILTTGLIARVTPAWKEAVFAIWEKSGTTQSLLNLIDQALSKKEELSPTKIKSTLNTILSRMAREQLNLEQVLDLILNEMAALIHAENANLSLVDNNKIKVKASTIGREGLNKEFDVEKSVVGLAVRWQNTVNIPDIENDELARSLFQPALGEDMRRGSEFAVPMMIGLEPIAVINFESPHKSAFKKSEINLIEELAGQVAIAINSARLQDQTNKVRNLSEISSEINTLVNKGEVEVANKTLEKMMEFMSCHKAAIFNHDDEQSKTDFIAHVGLSQEFILLDISINSARMWAINNKQAVIASDILTDERFIGVRDIAIRENFRAVLDFPLIVRDRIVGLITAYYTNTRLFDYEEIALYKLFADHIAVAINNARQYEELEAAKNNQKLAIVGELSGDIVHRMNSPLAAIKNNLELIQMDYSDVLKEMAPEIHETIEDIHRISKEAINMIQEMKINARKEIFQSVDTINILNSVIEKLLPNWPEKIQLITNFSEVTSPILVKANQSLSKVFHNLVTNAIEAMPQGGKLSIKVQLTTNQQALIIFEDTGIGIPPEWRDQIFNILSVFSKTKADGGGHGLGLWYSRAYIEACGGKLPDPDSIVGKGTKFSVYLPLAK